jgi:CMP-2-keto-3-deoxyoctulosonic acid synthetase|tara:strand:+ start:364 stop:489 length:126 start_codon:yes stop_codon:yes gene_type:complete
MVQEKRRVVEEIVSVVPSQTEDLEKLEQLEARVNQMKIASK